MNKELLYDVHIWETRQPIGISVTETTRRYWQKQQMKNDGMDEQGTWFEFKPRDMQPEVTEVLDILRNKLGITI